MAVIFKCEECGLELSGGEVEASAVDQMTDVINKNDDLVFFTCIKTQLDSVHSDVLLTVRLHCLKCNKVMPSNVLIRARELEVARKAELKIIKEAKAKEIADEPTLKEKAEKPINVNGRPKNVTGDTISYEEVAALAFPETPDAFFTITWHHDDGSGTLIAGQSTTVQDGMYFDVTETGN